MSHVERQAIRDSCLEEQYYLCAYCCQRIDDKNSHNEHIQAQSVAPNQMLNFHNIVASCNQSKQCGVPPLALWHQSQSRSDGS
ncbi:MAG: hypothetical protein ABFS56_01540 [Pseudomonadota bacterium]